MDKTKSLLQQRSDTVVTDASGLMPLLLRIVALALMLVCSFTLSAQTRVTLKGKIIDVQGDALPGAVISVVGSTRGAAADEDGNFELNNVAVGTKLKVTFLGMKDKDFIYEGKNNVTIVLEDQSIGLDEVTVVAFGKQKKESVISAIQTVNVNEIRIPSSNLTTAFAGRIAGMISYQTSGEPGHDNAEFFIRGVTTFGSGFYPLILIDNIEVSSSDLAKMHPDDIASFSILKDATATALYGARGANGVVLVTTKEGKEGKVNVNVRVENSFSSPTSVIEMADPVTYMTMANEAALTRDALAPYPYSRNKIEDTRNEVNPYAFPAVDWMGLLIKDITSNQRANINVSGGGKVARYYVAASVSRDNGILQVEKRNNFNNNVSYNKLLLRSNVNINLTTSTEMVVRLHGAFDDYQGPVHGGSTMYQQILKVSPVRFPAYFKPDEKYAKAGHILFGNDGENGSYMNPYAEMVKGYKQESTSMMMAQIELKQDFGAWVKGLTAELLGNTKRNASFDMSRAYSPFYYSVQSYDRITDIYTLQELNAEGSGAGTDYLGYTPGDKVINSLMYGEARLNYTNSFDALHNVSGMLVATGRNYLSANETTLSNSLPQRNLGLSGRFTYNFGERYFAEFNFGYNGSEKFDAGHRWGFFPSYGVGWIVSNEQFWSGSVKDLLSLLKFRFTYGLVGNDNISSQRFFYLSEVIPSGGGSWAGGYDFNGFGSGLKGYKISAYANPTIGWEIAYKTNLGIEMGLFKGKVNATVDLYKEHRTNILMSRADIPVTMGLWATPMANVGEARGKGIDVALDYNHSINRDLWVTGRFNFTYAVSKYDFYEEPRYAEIDLPWLSHVGRKINQPEGYVAQRLFIDEYDLANSPTQSFGEYKAGDIKYKDLNGDGVISIRDRVAIGWPTTPEINYGFGLSAGYKGFDASVFFQGSAHSSFFIDAGAMSPFITGSFAGKTTENGLAKFIADDYWTELTMDPYSKWPRLSSYTVANNTQTSTWWLRDNPYLRFKSFELGYELPHTLLKRCHISALRIYLSGTNLFVWSDFDVWDVELGGNGLNYPLQRTVNVGLNVSF